MIPSGFVSIRAAFTRFCAPLGRGPQVAPEAAGKLIACLIAGRLKAVRFDPQGSKQSVPGEYWQERSTKFENHIHTDPIFNNIVVSNDELRDILDSAQGDLSAQNRGRKPEYDVNALSAVIAWTLHDEGLETSQEKMIDKVQQRYEGLHGKDSAPGRTTLQPMIKALFAAKPKGENKAGK